MERLIKIIEKNLVFINIEPIEKRYELLSKCSKKVNLIAPQDTIKTCNQLQKVTYQDIIYSYLLVYFDLTIPQLENYFNLLVEFLNNENLSTNEKNKIVLFAINSISGTDREDLLKNKSKIAEFLATMKRFTESNVIKMLGSNGEEILECLKHLAKTEYFYNIYEDIRDCYENRYEEVNDFYMQKLKEAFSLYKNYEWLDQKLKNDDKLKEYRKTLILIEECVRLGDPLTKETKIVGRKLTSAKKKNISNTQKLNILKRKLSNNRVVDLPFIVECRTVINNDRAFNEFLVEALKYNAEVISSIKNNEFDKDKKLELLFKKYRYDYSKFADSLKEKLIEICDNQFIDSILNLLEDNNIRLTNDNLGELLLNGSIGKISRVLTSVSKGYIDEEFINQNIKILYDDDFQARVLSNIDTLLNSELDIYKVIESNQQILTEDSKRIRNNLNILHQYGIYIKNQDVTNYEFLSDSSSFRIIDLFIEKRLFPVIINHPEYINNSYLTVLKRIHINRLIHNKIMTDKEIDNKILSGKGYFLEEDELDSYLCSHTDDYINSEVNNILANSDNNIIENSIYLDEVISKLDSEYLCDGNYLFGKTVISRIKFLRYYSSINKDSLNIPLSDIVFSCLIKDSYLTDSELIFIKECVINITKELTFVKK